MYQIEILMNYLDNYTDGKKMQHPEKIVLILTLVQYMYASG